MINKITIFIIFFFTMLLGGINYFLLKLRLIAYGMDEYFNYDVDKERQFLTYIMVYYMTEIGISGAIVYKYN